MITFTFRDRRDRYGREHPPSLGQARAGCEALAARLQAGAVCAVLVQEQGKGDGRHHGHLITCSDCWESAELGDAVAWWQLDHGFTHQSSLARGNLAAYVVKHQTRLVPPFRRATAGRTPIADVLPVYALAAREGPKRRVPSGLLGVDRAAVALRAW